MPDAKWREPASDSSRAPGGFCIRSGRRQAQVQSPCPGSAGQLVAPAANPGKQRHMAIHDSIDRRLDVDQHRQSTGWRAVRTGLLLRPMPGPPTPRHHSSACRSRRPPLDGVSGKRELHNNTPQKFRRGKHGPLPRAKPSRKAFQSRTGHRSHREALRARTSKEPTARRDRPGHQRVLARSRIVISA